MEASFFKNEIAKMKGLLHTASKQNLKLDLQTRVELKSLADDLQQMIGLSAFGPSMEVSASDKAKTEKEKQISDFMAEVNANLGRTPKTESEADEPGADDEPETEETPDDETPAPLTAEYAQHLINSFATKYKRSMAFIQLEKEVRENFGLKTE